MTVMPTAAMTVTLRNPMAARGITPTKAIIIRDTRNLDLDTNSREAATRRRKKGPRSNKHRSRRSAPVPGLIFQVAVSTSSFNKLRMSERGFNGQDLMVSLSNHGPPRFSAARYSSMQP